MSLVDATAMFYVQCIFFLFSERKFNLISLKLTLRIYPQKKSFLAIIKTDAMSLCFAIAWAAESQYLVSFRQFNLMRKWLIKIFIL